MNAFTHRKNQRLAKGSLKTDNPFKNNKKGQITIRPIVLGIVLLCIAAQR